MSYEKVVNAVAKGSGTRLNKDEAAALVVWVKYLVQDKLDHVDLAADEHAAAALAVARANKAEAAEKVLADTVAKLLDVQADLTARADNAEADSAAAHKANQEMLAVQAELAARLAEVDRTGGPVFPDVVSAAMGETKRQPTAQERARAMLS